MSLPRYAEYKDSEVEWLGEVPASWRVDRLKASITSCRNGIWGADPTGDTDDIECVRVADFDRVRLVVDGEVPTLRSVTEKERADRLVRAGDLLLEKSGGGEKQPVGQVVLYDRPTPAICSNFVAKVTLALDEVAMIDIEPEQLDRYRLRAGDVLMNEGGDFDKLGRGAIWNAEIEDCIHQNHVFAVRPHAVSPQWLNQITGSQYAQFYFMGRSKQSTNLASISSTNIMELPILLPPADEQASILSFVDNESARLDALYASSVQAIALLKERRSALIAAAVTGKIDVRQAA